MASNVEGADDREERLRRRRRVRLRRERETSVERLSYVSHVTIQIACPKYQKAKIVSQIFFVYPSCMHTMCFQACPMMLSVSV